MKRIAIVDDDPGVRLSAAVFLKTRGFTVEGFDGGSHFLGADPSGFDCILLDLEMPEMNGFAVLSALAAVADLPPIVVLTGSAGGAVGASAIELGAFELLEKPCPPAQLLEAVARAIGTGSAPFGRSDQGPSLPGQS